MNDYRNIPDTANIEELRIVYTRLYTNTDANSPFYDPDGTENLKKVRNIIADFNENADEKGTG